MAVLAASGAVSSDAAREDPRQSRPLNVSEVLTASRPSIVNAPTVRAGMPQVFAYGNPLPIAVTGVNAPDEIPDALAYRLFMLSTILPTKPNEARLKMQQLKMTRIGFELQDRTTYLQTMRTAAGPINANAEQRQRWSTPAAAKDPARRAALKALQESDEQTLDHARQQLTSQLTAVGRQRLDTYIQVYVKRRITTHKH
jgi:hypothetical protein